MAIKWEGAARPLTGVSVEHLASSLKLSDADAGEFIDSLVNDLAIYQAGVQGYLALSDESECSEAESVDS